MYMILNNYTIINFIIVRLEFKWFIIIKSSTLN